MAFGSDSIYKRCGAFRVARFMVDQITNVLFLRSTPFCSSKQLDYFEYLTAWKAAEDEI
jgi:hypothetical protein